MSVTGFVIMCTVGVAVVVACVALKYASIDYDPDSIVGFPEYPTRPLGKSSFCEINVSETHGSENPGLAQNGSSSKKAFD